VCLQVVALSDSLRAAQQRGAEEAEARAGAEAEAARQAGAAAEAAAVAGQAQSELSVLRAQVCCLLGGLRTALCTVSMLACQTPCPCQSAASACTRAHRCNSCKPPVRPASRSWPRCMRLPSRWGPCSGG
jgi:hypothetical protein